METLAPTPTASENPFSAGKKIPFVGLQQTQLKIRTSFPEIRPDIRLQASMEPQGLVQEHKSESGTIVRMDSSSDFFDEMKYRFLSFKRKKYMENLERYQDLAKVQAPKFMVIACADSRVCPSNILGFQPGEAFIVRNVANMVPPSESGPSETNAALDFAVNTLKVENIFVIGHSCCGGIRALMSMQDEEEEDSSFIGRWVVVGKNARLNTEAAVFNLSLDLKCRHCEKESVICSLSNLLTYLWIEEKVRQGSLSVHGGYYDFVECTFEKWTLDYHGTKTEGSNSVAIKNRSLWR